MKKMILLLLALGAGLGECNAKDKVVIDNRTQDFLYVVVALPRSRPAGSIFGTSSPVLEVKGWYEVRPYGTREFSGSNYPKYIFVERATKNGPIHIKFKGNRYGFYVSDNRGNGGNSGRRPFQSEVSSAPDPRDSQGYSLELKKKLGVLKTLSPADWYPGLSPQEKKKVFAPHPLHPTGKIRLKDGRIYFFNKNGFGHSYPIGKGFIWRTNFYDVPPGKDKYTFTINR